jgi:hypothetical protein
MAHPHVNGVASASRGHALTTGTPRRARARCNLTELAPSLFKAATVAVWA